MTEILRAARLTLRPLRDDDAPFIERHCGAWDVARMLRVVPWPYPPGMALDYIRRVRAPRSTDRGADRAADRTWALDASVSGGEPVLGVLTVKRIEGGVRLGYWLGRPWWGLGYMSEAVTTALSDAFDDPAVGFAEAGVFADNPASRRLLERLGFRFEVVDDVWNAARAEPAPYHLGRLSRADWLAHAARRDAARFEDAER